MTSPNDEPTAKKVATGDDNAATEPRSSRGAAGDGSAVDRATRSSRRPAAKPKNSILAGIKEFLIIVVVALIISTLVKAFVAQAFFIPSDSMESTLQKDDRVVVSKLTPGIWDIQRGDVIVFEDPGTWLTQESGVALAEPGPLKQALAFMGLAPDVSDNHLIKRIIGMPGDHVVCTSSTSKVQVNDTTLDESYVGVVNGVENSPCHWGPFDVTVPADQVFVMGDNRDSSADSAYHLSLGDSDYFVPMDNVTGKGSFVVWPFSKLSGLSDHDDMTKVPEASTSGSSSS